MEWGENPSISWARCGEMLQQIVHNEVMIPGQRVLVVKNTVIKALLDADFWVRLGEIPLNFRERK